MPQAAQPDCTDNEDRLMKKILGIVGSPRKSGNCEIMIKEISRQIVVPHELDLLRLSDFNIEPCRGCYQCLFHEEGCHQKDGFYFVLNSILNADALVLAAPTYFLGPNACLKQFIDRGLAFYAHIERMWAKPAVGVCVAGIEGKEGYSLLGIESFLKVVLADIKMTAVVYGALPGEIFIDEKNKKIAEKLALSLLSDKPLNKQPACPNCGGDTFRFIDNATVRCMLCSNTGIFSMKEGRPVFEIERSAHELFLTKEDVFEHRDWLKRMKNRFIEQKETLRQITGDYRRDGKWFRKSEV
jgi:multimeric flavodoxin WrbA